MSETETASPLKKKGGWPKGKKRIPQTDEPVQARMEKRPTMLAKMKSRPNWDDATYDTVGADEVDRLKIPRHIVEDLARDGIALQWITKSVRGAEMPQETAKFIKGGWTPVHQSDFDGVLDGMFMSKGDESGPIVVDDCMLAARPIEIDRKSKYKMTKEAQAPLRIKEQEIGHGIPGVTGATHPTVHNSIRKTVERIEVPDE